MSSNGFEFTVRVVTANGDDDVCLVSGFADYRRAIAHYREWASGDAEATLYDFEGREIFDSTALVGDDGPVWALPAPGVYRMTWDASGSTYTYDPAPDLCPVMGVPV